MFSAGIAALLICAMLYVFAGFPAWVAVSCARSTSITESARTAWMIAILLLFPVASWIYAIVMPNRALFKVSGWLSVGATIAACVFVVRLSATVAGELRNDVDRAAVAMADPGVAVVSDQRRRDVRESLATLHREVTGSLLRWDANAATARLVDLLGTDIADRQLSTIEYEEWRELFAARTVRPSGLIGRSIGNAQGFLDALIARKVR